MCWHKWSKWGEYIEKGIKIPIGIIYGKMRGQEFSYEESMQRRYCLKCGFIQDRKVRKL